MIKDKRLLRIFFVLMILAQIGVPAYMIYSKNQIIRSGETYKFKLQAIDPTDPYRGKYIILNPIERRYQHDTESDDINGEAYATFKTDSLGYASISKIYSSRPSTPHYLEVNLYSRRGNISYIKYPFNRYYMNEHKARPAETLVGEISESSKICYAEVAVYKGQHSLLSVKIDGIDIEELVLANE